MGTRALCEVTVKNIPRNPKDQACTQTRRPRWEGSGPFSHKSVSQLLNQHTFPASLYHSHYSISSFSLFHSCHSCQRESCERQSALRPGQQADPEQRHFTKELAQAGEVHSGLHTASWLPLAINTLVCHHASRACVCSRHCDECLLFS